MREILSINDSKPNSNMQTLMDEYSRNVSPSPMNTLTNMGSIRTKSSNPNNFRIVQKLDSSANKSSYINRMKK